MRRWQEHWLTVGEPAAPSVSCYNKTHEVKLCSCAFSVGWHKCNIFMASSEAWCNSDWNNARACMSECVWPEVFTLKRVWSLFEELSEVTALIPPGGNTGSERVSWSWTCLTGLWPPRLITFKLSPVLGSLVRVRKLRLGNTVLVCLCAEAGMHGLCLYLCINLNGSFIKARRILTLDGTCRVIHQWSCI